MWKEIEKNCANCDAKITVPLGFETSIFHCVHCVEKKYRETLKDSLYGTALFLAYMAFFLFLNVILFLYVFEDINKNPADYIIFRIVVFLMTLGIFFLYPWRNFFMFRKERKKYEEIKEINKYVNGSD